MEPMNRNIWIVFGITVALGFCYVVFNTEWLKPDPIQIQAQVREVSARANLERRVPASKVVIDESKLPKDPAEREKAIKELRAAARREPNRGLRRTRREERERETSCRGLRAKQREYSNRRARI